MNARSALFDLYGDHLLSRGGRAPVAALVRLLAPLGVAPPAVRTAVSRMVRQAWLEPVRLAEGRGYALTPRAVRRLDEAWSRIYRTERVAWDGCWHVVVVARPSDRAGRERLRSGLAFLGYAALEECTWIGPHGSVELDALLENEGLTAERLTARHDGGVQASKQMVERAWDIATLGEAYAQWLEEAEKIVAGAGLQPDDEQAFAARSQLVHEWRKFLFRDPGLPRELLPPEWPGESAAAFFDREARRLAPAASRFVDRCLQSERGESA